MFDDDDDDMTFGSHWPEPEESTPGVPGLFEKGGPGGPGRSKGTKVFKRSIEEKLRQMDIDVVQELGHIIEGNHKALGVSPGEVTMKMRADTLVSLLPYLHEKKKSVQKHEIRGGGSAGGVSISIMIPDNAGQKPGFKSQPKDITPEPAAIEHEGGEDLFQVPQEEEEYNPLPMDGESFFDCVKVSRGDEDADEHSF